MECNISGMGSGHGHFKIFQLAGPKMYHYPSADSVGGYCKQIYNFKNGIDSTLCG